MQDLYAARVRAIYERVELWILEAVRKRAARGVKEAGWAEAKAAEIAALRESLRGQLPGLLSGVPEDVREAVEAGYDAGGKEAGKELIAAELTNPAPQAYTRGASVRAIVKEAVGNLVKTHPRILRSALDAYRDVIAGAAEDVITGVATRQSAVQRALNMFADRGITGFVDSAGRSWDMASYAEMATRSAVIRSSVAGKSEKYQAADQDLVVVSDHWEECDLCRPWEGRVLSLSGKTSGYPTLAEAEGAGLFHPACRHTTNLWIPGVSETPRRQTPVDKAEAEKVYKERLTQRRLERGVRQWKRREMVALDPVEQAKASRKVIAWQKGLDAHIEVVNKRRAGTGIPAMKKQPGRAQVIFAPDAVRSAKSAGARRNSIKLQAEAREQAQYEKERSQIVREWMDSSSKPASIVTKTAAAEAFGGSGMVWNPRGHKPDPEAIKKSVGVLRKMHAQTQEHLKHEGIKSIKLYRGVASRYDIVGSIESWSESMETARRFAGLSGIILEEDVSAERLIYGHRVPGWKDSKKFGPQQEWMILPDTL